MLPELAERARRRDHHQRLIIVAERPRLQHLGGVGGEAVLRELVEVGLLIGRTAVADAGEGAARPVALDLPILRVGLTVLALDDQVCEIAVALRAEEERLLAIGDKDEAVMGDLHRGAPAVRGMNEPGRTRFKRRPPGLAGPARSSRAAPRSRTEAPCCRSAGAS